MHVILCELAYYVQRGRAFLSVFLIIENPVELYPKITKNEKDFSDNQFQNELDLYINEYIKNFNKENFKDGVHLNSIKIYYDDALVRNVQKNNV